MFIDLKEDDQKQIFKQIKSLYYQKYVDLNMKVF